MKALFSTIVISCFIAITSCNNINLNDNNPSKTNEAVEAMKGSQKIVSPKDGVFIHLSSGPEAPQKVLMAFSMAKLMSDDKEVMIYIDIKGVYTILKDAEDITFKEFPSSLTLLGELKEKGVNVVVCPTCLKAADKTSDDILDWVSIATKDKFFDFCDGKILSFNY